MDNPMFFNLHKILDNYIKLQKNDEHTNSGAVGLTSILLHLRLRGHGNPVKVWSVQATNYISSPTYNDIEWNPFEVDEAL